MDESLSFDPASPVFHENPHSVLGTLRKLQPVLRGRQATALSGRTFTIWHLFSYADIVAALKDPRMMREIRHVLTEEELGRAVPIPEEFRALVDSQRNMMLFRDPPDHTRLRNLVNKAFTPRMVQQLASHIEDIARDLLAPWPAGEQFDLVHEFAFPLPVIVIAELLGVPKADRDLVKGWSRIFAQVLDVEVSLETLLQGNQMIHEFQDYFRDLIDERTRNPRQDLISSLLEVTDDEGGQLTVQELLDMGILLLVAGHETTRNLIANAAWMMCRMPDMAHALRRAPHLIPGAVEEVLRMEPPVMLTSRFLAEDLHIQGIAMKRGDEVNLWLASANRDAAVFGEPDQFQPNRSPNRHLSFGQGIHYCLGAPLARQEGAIALHLLLTQYPRLTLAETPLRWTASSTFRSLTALEIETSL